MTVSSALDPIRPLVVPAVADGERRGERMPSALRQRYGSDLLIPLRGDRPAVIANFVSTIDGVVAFDAHGQSGGGEVSGFYEPDRFVMGLLRALADVVVVGAGTVRAAPDHIWTAQHVHRASSEAYARWRADLGLPANPTTIVVTASGELPVGHPGLTDALVPVVVMTTSVGAARVRSSALGSQVGIRTARREGAIEPHDIVGVAAELGGRLVLCEGGPHVLGELVESGLVDELFLTLAPQLAGRDRGTERLALIEGSAFDVETAPWASLRSVHAAGDHLFLRYGVSRSMPH